MRRSDTHSYCQLFVLSWDKDKLDVIMSMLTSFVVRYFSASMVFLSPLAFIWQEPKSAIITRDTLLFLNLCSLISYWNGANTKENLHIMLVAKGELSNDVVDDWKWKKMHYRLYKESKKRSKYIYLVPRCIWCLLLICSTTIAK